VLSSTGKYARLGDSGAGGGGTVGGGIAAGIGPVYPYFSCTATEDSPGCLDERGGEVVGFRGCDSGDLGRGGPVGLRPPRGDGGKLAGLATFCMGGRIVRTNDGRCWVESKSSETDAS
jgi:hypothetical protein